MRVRVIASFATAAIPPGRALRPGEEVEIPEQLASAWVRAGLVEPIGDQGKEQEVETTATPPARETTARARPRPRARPPKQKEG